MSKSSPKVKSIFDALTQHMILDIRDLPYEVSCWCSDNGYDLASIGIEQLLSPVVQYPPTFYLDADGVGRVLCEERSDQLRYLVDTILKAKAEVFDNRGLIYPLQIVRDHTKCPLQIGLMLAEAMREFIDDVSQISQSDRMDEYKYFESLMLREYDLSHEEVSAVSFAIVGDHKKNSYIHLNMYLSACEDAVQDLTHQVTGRHILDSAWFKLLMGYLNVY